MMLLDVALVGISLSFAFALRRVLVGPTIADRAVAADVALYGVIAAIALLTLRQGAFEFLDVILVATLLGFLATVALSLLVGRRGS
jgi:multicomponent Na+:H+ antiporter subunit F